MVDHTAMDGRDAGQREERIWEELKWRSSGGRQALAVTARSRKCVSSRRTYSSASLQQNMMTHRVLWILTSLCQIRSSLRFHASLGRVRGRIQTEHSVLANHRITVTATLDVGCPNYSIVNLA